MSQKNIVIVGAGISALSCAWMLRNSGAKITVLAKAFSPDITSNRAAAFWFPYHIRNDRRGIDWCNTSYDFYKKMSADAATGISMQTLIKVLRNGVEDAEPVWLDFMPQNSWHYLNGEELPAGMQTAYAVTVPLIETQVFLPYLQQQLASTGINFQQQEIKDLYALQQHYDVVINCTALGSRELCNDNTLVPVRGQVALLSPTGNAMNIYLDNELPLYVVPRKDAIIVGGTYEEYVSTDITEPHTIQRLLNNAFEWLPELKQQHVIGSWAGIRPYRETVRVEQEHGTNIVHNYGHGGSGFTLAFGCATSVMNIVNEM